jgi:hypothetical protein
MIHWKHWRHNVRQRPAQNCCRPVARMQQEISEARWTASSSSWVRGFLPYPVQRQPQIVDKTSKQAHLTLVKFQTYLSTCFVHLHCRTCGVVGAVVSTQRHTR